MHWIALQAQPEATAAGSHHAPLADALTALGWSGLQYTPRVARLADAVLLEVSASERLWGGRAALLQHLRQSSARVADVRCAQGATSLLALGRLRAGRASADDLPLSALDAARPHLETFLRMGCDRWGQLRALPRGALARRFGASLLQALDQAYGEAPDLYPWLALPAVFEATLELATPVDNAAALQFGARRLLAQLRLWLGLRQLGVLALELGWTMDARRGSEHQGSLVLRSAAPAIDMEHLQRLLGEQLERLCLAAPVVSLRLRSLETVALAGRSASLLPDEAIEGDSVLQMVERLSARLGPHKVLRWQACADHRPERMQAWMAASDMLASSPAANSKAGPIKGLVAAPGLDAALYPGWLLPEPLALTVHQGCPHYQGPLTLLAGPQRVEAGWWEGHTDEASGLVLRDYFVARSAHSVLLWIFRERAGAVAASGTGVQTRANDAPRWYLHGLFA